MKANYELCLSGENVILVPYRPEHVPTYHGWMTDTRLLELTSSEPLTMDEEVRMQSEWRDDENKCTFVILARDLLDLGDGDDDAFPPPPPPIEVEDGGDREDDDDDRGDRRSYPSLIGRTLHAMIGDVNLFLSDDVDEGDVEEKEEEGGSRDHSSARSQAEIDVMIAVASHRRRDLGAEVALVMMHYAASHLSVSRFFAKVHETNVPSLRLFEIKLGYERCGYAECFSEYELVCRRESPEEMTTWIEGRWREWRTMEKKTPSVVEAAAMVEDGGGCGGVLLDRDDDGNDDGEYDGVDEKERRQRLRRDCRVRMYDVCDCPL